MPSDTSPRILRFSILKSPGRRPPTVASGTTMPAWMFGAPHTTRTTPSPVSTSASCSLSALRVREDLEDPRDDDAADLRARLFDLLDLEAEVVERGRR